jgi:N-acyl-D-aspartate/D-glutamate deacylase
MHDLAITGGMVHDGLGSPSWHADVVIDAEGLFVAPGFVDAHSHSDALPLMAEPQPFNLLQGVTTDVVGNCGFSVAPLAGHGTLRLTANGTRRELFDGALAGGRAGAVLRAGWSEGRMP